MQEDTLPKTATIHSNGLGTAEKVGRGKIYMKRSNHITLRFQIWTRVASPNGTNPPQSHFEVILHDV